MVQDVNECGVRRDELIVENEKTVELFETIYHYIREIADKRGDKDSNFIV